MPVYGFKCDKCEKNVEKIILHKVDVSIEEQIAAVISAGCECGGKLVKSVGVPNLKFVGPDFYVTEERARREKQRIAKDVSTANRNIAKQEHGKAQGTKS